MSTFTGLGGASDPSSVDLFSSTREPPKDAYDDLTSEDFMDLILAELANQDPLEPNDTQALIDQISSIREIESDLNLTEQFEALVDDSAFSSASALIGGVVTGRATDGTRVNGDAEVTSVIRSGDDTLLGLADGRRVRIGDVDEVALPEIILPAAPPPEGEATDEPADVLDESTDDTADDSPDESSDTSGDDTGSDGTDAGGSEPDANDEDQP